MCTHSYCPIFFQLKFVLTGNPTERPKMFFLAQMNNMVKIKIICATLPSCLSSFSKWLAMSIMYLLSDWLFGRSRPPPPFLMFLAEWISNSDSCHEDRISWKAARHRALRRDGIFSHICRILRTLLAAHFSGDDTGRIIFWLRNHSPYMLFRVVSETATWRYPERLHGYDAFMRRRYSVHACYQIGFHACTNVHRGNRPIAAAWRLSRCYFDTVIYFSGVVIGSRHHESNHQGCMKSIRISQKCIKSKYLLQILKARTSTNHYGFIILLVDVRARIHFGFPIIARKQSPCLSSHNSWTRYSDYQTTHYVFQLPFLMDDAWRVALNFLSDKLLQLKNFAIMCCSVNLGLFKTLLKSGLTLKQHPDLFRRMNEDEKALRGFLSTFKRTCALTFVILV